MLDNNFIWTYIFSQGFSPISTLLVAPSTNKVKQSVFKKTEVKQDKNTRSSVSFMHSWCHIGASCGSMLNTIIWTHRIYCINTRKCILRRIHQPTNTIYNNSWLISFIESIWPAGSSRCSADIIQFRLNKDSQCLHLPVTELGHRHTK